MAATQSFKSHTRWDPIYHFFTIPLLLANIVVTGVNYAHSHAYTGFGGIWSILIAVALFFLALKARMYALGDQDRIIRLEERLRLHALLPAEERAHINDLSTKQLIALRFASDDELPALFRKTLTQNLEPKAIKKSIVNWRPDYERV